MRTKFLVFVLVMALAAASAPAQMGQTGGIRGVVALEGGGALPSVAVTLRSPAMILEKMTALTNAEGQYRFVNLPPGRYELTFEMSGMTTVIRKDIVVSANVSFTVDVQLSAKEIEESIVVVGQAPTIDRQSVTKVATLDKNFLESIPAARDLGTYFNMAPGVTSGSSHGASVRDNTYQLDGIKLNDPAVGTQGAEFGIDIMEEISVQTGGLSAEHGSTKGAVVNVVTKSGGNTFSGSLSAYFNHKNLQSDNTQGTPLAGSGSAPKYEIEPVLTFGGPVVKDKMWFFLNMGIYKAERLVAGFPYDQAEQVPNAETNLFPYGKLTFQPTQEDKFALSFSYTNNKINNDGASIYDTVDTTSTYKDPTYVLSAIWSHVFGSSFFTELKFGASSSGLSWYAKNPEGLYWEWSTGRNSNSAGWDDIYSRKRLQMNADGTLFLDDVIGGHEWKFGVEGSYGDTLRRVVVYGEQDAIGIPRIYTYTYNGEPYYAAWGGGHEQIARALNAAAYVNDTWQITKRLALNLGLRFEYAKNYFPPQAGALGVPSSGNYAHIGYPGVAWDMEITETVSPFTWKNFSPRLGFVFDLLGDGKTLLKANYSRYLQDNYTSISFELHPANWLWYEAYTDENAVPTSISYVYAPGADIQVGYQGSKLKTPYTDEFAVGVEQELFEDWSVGARFVRRLDKGLIETVDGTSVDMDELMNNGELVWNPLRWVPTQVTDPYDGSTQTIYLQDWDYWEPRQEYMVNPPGLKRDYTALEFTLRKRISKGWSFDLSYVFNNAKGVLGTSFWQTENRTGLYDDPNGHINAYGPVDLQRKHQLKFTGTLKGPLGINLSSYFRYLSGQPYTRTINALDFGLDQDEAVRAEARGSRELPALVLLDLRLEKEFLIGNTTIRVFGDIFNALNQGVATSVITTSSNPDRVFERMDGIQAPRVFRLGAKIGFNL